MSMRIEVKTVLQLTAVTVGVVLIKAQETGHHLAMNNEGRLYASPDENEECHFLERKEKNLYHTYQSCKYNQENSWYVALNENGQPELGPDTNIGQKAIFFLTRKLAETSSSSGSDSCPKSAEVITGSCTTLTRTCTAEN
ncbi:putative fibroblast growth factor 1 isoform X2 [Festucalex cinctus]